MADVSVSRRAVVLLLVGLVQGTQLGVLARTADFMDDAIEETDYLADALKIKHQRDELVALRVSEKDPVCQTRISYLQGRITHRLLVDFFEINSMVAEVTDEIEGIDRRIAMAERRRFRQIGLLNAANFATTGTLGVIGNSFGIPANSVPTVPAIMGTVGAATSVGLSAFTLALSRSGKIKVPNGSANVLAYVFDPESTAPNFPLPIVVKEYLHRKSEKKTDTRAHKLIAYWKSAGLLRSGSPSEIAALCQTCDEKYTTLDVLRSQSMMLRSLRTSLVQTNKGLMKLAEHIDDEELAGD